MKTTLKMNARNDLHLPANVIRELNLGEDRIFKAEVRANVLILIPVDLEPRYTHQELEAVDKIHEKEKKKGFIPLDSDDDMNKLIK